jgi:hypothetical protein
MMNMYRSFFPQLSTGGLALNESKPCIASDIDGTIVESGGDVAFLQHLERNGHENATSIFRETHSWEVATGLTREAIDDKYVEFVTSKWYEPPPPLPGASVALASLSLSNRIHLVTARSAKTQEHTLAYLRREVKFRISGYAFSALGRKGRFVQEAGAYLYIEDNPSHAEEWPTWCQ